jgi:hypothetical protein
MKTIEEQAVEMAEALNDIRDYVEADGTDTAEEVAKAVIRQSVALRFCLTTLKRHHMTKRGISETVRRTEALLSNTRPDAPGEKDGHENKA